MRRFFTGAALLLAALSCTKAPAGNSGQEPAGETVLPKALVVSAKVDGTSVPASGKLAGTSLSPVISLEFTREVKADEASLEAVSFSGGALKVSVSPSDATVLDFSPLSPLEPMHSYQFELAEGACFGVQLKKAYSLTLVTGVDDSADKFPRIPDEELLTLVQQQTFNYFWSYAHPVSGLARERLGSGNTVTSGGSGFGIMCLPVGVERGFITRAEGAERLRTIVKFLKDKAQRFHGAYPHWLDGESGKVIPFSANDNGGDLVETAFLIQGLLTAAHYFDAPEEEDIRSGIDAIWRDVEWDWYTRGQNVLYWHWSPDRDWAMNMQIKGWNEGLIVYVLAASSPTHPVDPAVYHEGWASSGGMRPGKDGPLFFAHYSFLGLDPRSLKDRYADYWEQNVAHARYNYDYCVRNPKRHGGYSADCWGLTASDYPGGYTASSPVNDHGTIAPTAAVASYPYLPEESLRAIRYFYYVLGDRLWGTYGFRDAFSLDALWFAGSYIAIDQGPIVVMLENARTGLLWNCFMQDEDVQSGLTKLGFAWK